MKICKKCNIEHKRKGIYCSKVCKDKMWYQENKEKKKQYHAENKEHIREREKKYKNNNKEKIVAKMKNYYKDNCEKIKAEKKEYRKNNRDLINAYHREYYKDINNRLRKNLRGRLSCAISRGLKGGSAVKDLGCTMEEFKTYISLKFQDGMNWENYGWGEDKWHLDHIKPLILFNLSDKEEFNEAAHYTNYQPLW